MSVKYQKHWPQPNGLIKLYKMQGSVVGATQSLPWDLIWLIVDRAYTPRDNNELSALRRVCTRFRDRIPRKSSPADVLNTATSGMSWKTLLGVIHRCFTLGRTTKAFNMAISPRHIKRLQGMGFCVVTCPKQHVYKDTFSGKQWESTNVTTRISWGSLSNELFICSGDCCFEFTTQPNHLVHKSNYERPEWYCPMHSN